ncbi:hypothetical protein BDQ17DRAFT_1540386 [Cyathus striatus]|nr:hypothetical protein BDQ17DRAFT_1540386 [Cyathus striatus]
MSSILTKQINSYGKRSRRIIDVPVDSTLRTTQVNSIFDDIPPPPKLTNLASKMKRRENSVPKPGTSSPKVVLQQKKSMAVSPARRTRIGPTVQIRGKKLNTKVKAASGSLDRPIIISDDLSRAPLSNVPVNIPASPAITEARAGKVPVRDPLRKAKRRFTPYLDMEIITLDEDGRTIHKEKRVSKIGIEMNPINNTIAQKPCSSIAKTDSPPSSPESVIQPKRFARRITKKVIVLSSDESDVEDLPLPEIVNPKLLKPIAFALPRLKLEVVIPPAPYPLHSRKILNNILSSPSVESSSEVLSERPQRIPSPIPRRRQLTPIRSRTCNKLFEPPSPPSPTTPTDFDLSVDFGGLNIGPQENGPFDFHVEADIPEYLAPLLEECGQEGCGPYEFSAFIESFPYDHIFNSQGNHLDMKFRKIGEASYSEVFGIGDVVLKVVPLRDERSSKTSAMGSHIDNNSEDGPAPSDAKDVRKEIIVTRAMCDVYDGFVKLLKTYVVRGRYPEVLLQLWDEYNEQKGSESIRPDTFKVSQLYAIIVLPNGGPDLEAYSFAYPGKTGWRQACSLFWQVAKSLAHAERLVSFEHRDLHWGQILVKNIPAASQPLQSLNVNQTTKQAHPTYMDDLSHGVRATIIDLGLSRMDAGDGGDGARVHWTPFDEEIFHGEGDYQFDIYRMMKVVAEGAWEDFYPMTNVLWLHYLTRKLLKSKGLRPPVASRKIKGALETAAASRTFSERDCYDCLVDIDERLAQCISQILEAKVGKLLIKAKGKRKKQLSKNLPGPVCAGEVVEYAVKKGWVKPIL